MEEIDPAVDASRAAALLRERGRTGTALLAVTANRAFSSALPEAAAQNFSPGFPRQRRSMSCSCTNACWKEC